MESGIRLQTGSSPDTPKDQLAPQNPAIMAVLAVGFALNGHNRDEYGLLILNRYHRPTKKGRNNTINIYYEYVTSK